MPVAYSGALLAVAVHEVLGHGVSAILLGGEFTGFLLRLDVMGYASAWPAAHAPIWRQIAVLSGGVVSTTVFGAAFLMIALRLRNAPFLRIGLAVLASCFVLNGSLYMLWNSYQPRPPGDIGRIIQLTESNTIRWAVFLAGAALTAIFLIGPMAIVVRESNRWLQSGSVPRKWQRALMPVVIGSAFGVGQSVFDWNQIAAGIGMVPRYCGMAFAIITIIVLMLVPPDTRPVLSPSRSALRPVAWAWIATLVLIAAISIWLQDGVQW